MSIIQSESKSIISGFCSTAILAELHASTDQKAWHAKCRGAWSQPSGIIRCSCDCHTGSENPRDMDAEIKEARLIRELRGEPQSHYPGINSKAAARADGKCKNDHEMTPENTGPGNVCRHCKRQASTRHKEKKAQELKATSDSLQ